MKATKSLLHITTLALMAVCCWAMPALADDGPKQLKVKGLYLGMDLEAARDICKKFIDDSMFIREKTADSFGIFSQTGHMLGIIGCEADKKVGMIALERPIVDKMFDSAGMPVEEFGGQFISAYNIPSMKPFMDQNSSGWRFISSHGYKVEIHDTGGLLIQKMAKRGSLKFD
jgi:hypothetical protein